VEASELARVSAALQKQVARDLAPLWGISATVDAFPELEKVPPDYWPILVSTGETKHEAGRLFDEHAQPYAHVVLSPHWSVAASRACLEMLVNPSGNRTVVSTSPRYEQGFVQMLVEICAPCGEPCHAYIVNDVLVSDFCTQAFFESGGRSGQERSSFCGSIVAPLQVLEGGHLTWFDATSDGWWMRTQQDGEPVDTRLGRLDPEIGGVRELVRRYAPARKRTSMLSYEAFETRARLIRAQASLAAHARARWLRSSIGQHVEASAGAFAEAFAEDSGRFAPSAPALREATEEAPGELAASSTWRKAASRHASFAPTPTPKPVPARKAPERSRDRLDPRLLTAALACAALLVLALAQRGAHATFSAGRPAPTPRAASAAREDVAHPQPAVSVETLDLGVPMQIMPTAEEPEPQIEPVRSAPEQRSRARHVTDRDTDKAATDVGVAR
jgi:hypothetical protein